MQITGVLLFFFLIFGYIFAASWPGRQQLLRRLKMEELFSIYEVFYITHVVMGVALLVLLLTHSWPDSLSSHQRQQRGTTWIYLLAGTSVCLLIHCKNLYVFHCGLHCVAKPFRTAVTGHLIGHLLDWPALTCI